MNEPYRSRLINGGKPYSWGVSKVEFLRNARLEYPTNFKEVTDTMDFYWRVWLSELLLEVSTLQLAHEAALKKIELMEVSAVRGATHEAELERACGEMLEELDTAKAAIARLRKKKTTHRKTKVRKKSKHPKSN